MKLIRIDRTNNHVYENLSQAYEAEFSTLTGTLPNSDGLYTVQSQVNLESQEFGYQGYLCQVDGRPVGFVIYKNYGDYHDVAEFFIIPNKRRGSLGTNLAHGLFCSVGGTWQVRQISGADHAIKFWRRVIEAIDRDYLEEQIEDKEWGRVTRQTFLVGGKA